MLKPQESTILSLLADLQHKQCYASVPLKSVVSKTSGKWLFSNATYNVVSVILYLKLSFDGCSVYFLLRLDRHAVCSLAEKYNPETRRPRFSFMMSDNLQRDKQLAKNIKDFFFKNFAESEHDAIREVLSHESIACLSICADICCQKAKNHQQREKTELTVVIAAIVFLHMESKGTYIFYVATTKDKYDKRFGSGGDKKSFRSRGLGRYLFKMVQMIDNVMSQGGTIRTALFLTVPQNDRGLLEMYRRMGFQHGWGESSPRVCELLQQTEESLNLKQLQKMYLSADHDTGHYINQFPVEAIDINLFGGILTENGKKKLGDLRLTKAQLEVIDGCIKEVVTVPNILAREVFTEVVSNPNTAGGFKKWFSVGSVCGLFYRELVRYNWTTNANNALPLEGRTVMVDCVLNVFCEMVSLIKVQLNNGTFSIHCGCCSEEWFHDQISGATTIEEVIKFLLNVNLWCSEMEKFYSRHCLAVKRKSTNTGAHETDANMKTCSCFSPSSEDVASKQYEYLHSLVKQDQNIFTDCAKAAQVVEFTMALWNYCIETVAPSLGTFFKDPCSTYSVIEYGCWGIPQVIRHMTMLPDGDKVQGIPHSKLSLAEEIHIRSVINVVKFPRNIELINENDWTAVASKCPLVPVQDMCSCSMEVSKNCDGCAKNTSCSFIAMNMECGKNCKCGDKCQNQHIRRAKKFEFVQLFDAGKKGLGLKATKAFVRDEFIMEYVGIVSHFTNDINSYKVHLKQSNLVVDARKKGNFARFVNHSCDPNCILEIWEVSDQFGDLTTLLPSLN